MPEKQYVALQPLRLGERMVQPGEQVPVIPGRSYHQMLSLGQIAEKPESGPASLPDGAYAALLLVGSIAVFVDDEGQPNEVMYQGTQEPDEAARVTLDLEPGQLAALVEFPDESGSVLVTFESLTWGDAAALLMRRLLETETARAELETRLAAATRSLDSSSGFQSQVEWLELMLKAVQTPGEVLADTQVGAKELAAVGITTREGLQLLASGDQALHNLIRLEGIGKKTAERILASLTPPGSPEVAGGADDPPQTQPEN